MSVPTKPGIYWVKFKGVMNTDLDKRDWGIAKVQEGTDWRTKESFLFVDCWEPG